MALFITNFINVANAIICGVCSLILYRSYLKGGGRNPVILYFSKGYFSTVFSFIFFSFPFIFTPHNSYYIGIGFMIANAFFYVAIAYFSKVTMFFINIKWAARAFWVVIFLSAIATLLNIFYLGYPTYNSVTGIINWDINPVVGISSLIIFGGVLFPSAIFFLRQGWRSQEKIVRARSLIIGSGLTLLTVTALTYYIATTPLVAFISEVFSLFSFLIIFFGILYKRKGEVTQSKI
ncbi:MAG: hypothetical protein WCV50_05175 [Patescibacteria group bacterium]|jgi:hypothetical protein